MYGATTGTANKSSSSGWGFPVKASNISTSTGAELSSSSTPASSLMSFFWIGGFGSLKFPFLVWLELTSLFFLFFFASFAEPDDLRKIML